MAKSVLSPVTGVLEADSSADLVNVSPLSLRGIQRSYFSGEIGLYEAHSMLKEYRSFEVWGAFEDKSSGVEKKYLYCKLPKRGSPEYFKRKQCNPKIMKLLSLPYLLCEEFPLVEDGKTHFLMLTLTKKAIKDSVDDLNKWNSAGCSSELVLFKKRFRSRYGQNIQFARFSEAHVSGFIHEHLLVFSPDIPFEVFEHVSRKSVDRYGMPVVSWRLKSREEKDSISSMHVTADPKTDFVDVVGFDNIKQFVEYGLKYQLKCFIGRESKAKSDWTLSVLSLFNKRGLSISNEFLDGIYDYCVERTKGKDSADLISIMSYCPERDKEDSVYEMLSTISRSALSQYGEFEDQLWKSSFKSEKCPPNIRAVPAHKDFLSYRKVDLEFSLNEPVGYELISTREALIHVFKKVASCDVIAVDTETTGLDKYSDSLVGISVSYASGKGFYVPVGHKEGNVSLEDAQECFNPVFEDSKVLKVFHNAKFDVSILQRHGFLVNCDSIFDTQIAVHSYDSSKKFCSLDLLSSELFSQGMVPYSWVVGSGDKEIGFDMVSPEDAFVYAVEDVVVTYELYRYFSPLIFGSFLELSYQRDVGLLSTIIPLEFGGACIDEVLVAENKKSIDIALRRIEESIFLCVGGELNLNSPKQLCELFFDDLGLDSVKNTPRGVSSVDNYVLTMLDDEHFIVPLIREYRGLLKMGTFIGQIEENLVNSFVHSEYHLVSTETGRLSCSRPNMQQVPKESRIRKIVVPSKEGNVLIKADYSQMELRVLAHCSKDESLVRCFKEGVDVHTKTAELLFRKPVAKDDVERKIAKSVNFGVVYGMSPAGLVKRLWEESGIEVSLIEAYGFIQAFYRSYSKILPFFEGKIQEAIKEGYLVTEFGSRRFFPFIGFSCGGEAVKEKRKARNFLIQGASADIMKMVMSKVHGEMLERGLSSRMVLSVHDELVFDVPMCEIEEMKLLIRACMEQVVVLGVPLEVDISVLTSWDSADVLEEVGLDE